MRRAGVAESVAMTISGHQSPLSSKRYDITSHEDQRSALAATEAYRAQRWAAKVTPLEDGQNADSEAGYRCVSSRF
jgi:hypothetical protein